jgi:hypothetical protein
MTPAEARRWLKANPRLKAQPRPRRRAAKIAPPAPPADPVAPLWAIQEALAKASAGVGEREPGLALLLLDAELKVIDAIRWKPTDEESDG